MAIIKYLKIVLWVSLFITCTGCMSRAVISTAPYDAKKPMAVSQIFAEGIISTNHEQNISFMPDGQTVFFERANKQFLDSYHCKVVY